MFIVYENIDTAFNQRETAASVYIEHLESSVLYQSARVIRNYEIQSEMIRA